MHGGDWTHSGGNIDKDPLFVNTAGGNYHLKAASPCRNGGIFGHKYYAMGQWFVVNYSFIPDDDFEGDSRDSDWIEETSGNFYKYCDIGADEFTPKALPHVPLLLLDQ